MSGVVVRNVRRTDRATVDALGRYGVATIHEAQGRINLLDPALRPIYPGARIAGTLHDDPGTEVGQGQPSVRVRIDSKSIALWPVSTSSAFGEWDRSVVATQDVAGGHVRPGLHGGRLAEDGEALVAQHRDSLQSQIAWYVVIEGLDRQGLWQ